MKYADIENIYADKLLALLFKHGIIRTEHNHSKIMTKLSKNPTISLEIIKKYDDCDWDWTDGITHHPKLNIAFIEQYIDEDWSWGSSGLSTKPFITVEFINKYSNKPWNWYTLSSRNDLLFPLFILEDLIDKFWNWRQLSKWDHINLDFVNKYPSKSWCWGSLSRKPELTIEFINKYSTMPWDWEYILDHSSIKYLDFLTHFIYSDKLYMPGLNCLKLCISEHPQLNIEYIINFPKNYWNWSSISKHKNIT